MPDVGILLALSRALLVEPSERWPALVERAVASVGRRAGADRAWVVGPAPTASPPGVHQSTSAAWARGTKSADDRGRTIHTQVWCRDGVAPPGWRCDLDPDDLAALQRGEDVRFASVADLAPADRRRDVLMAQGIRSRVMAPLRIGDEFLGLVGLDNPDERELDDTTVVLGFLADLIATAADRRARLKLPDAERARLTLLLRGAATTIYLATDHELVVEQVSPSITRCLGCTPDDVEAPALWLERIHPGDRERMLHSIRSSEAGSRLVHEYRLRDTDGDSRWFRDELQVMAADGAARHAIGVTTDVTPRVIAERRLDSLTRLQATIAKVSQAFAMHADTSGAVVGALGCIMNGVGARRVWLHLASPRSELHAVPDEGRWSESVVDRIREAMADRRVVLSTPDAPHAANALLLVDQCWCVSLAADGGLLVIEAPQEQELTAEELGGLLGVLGDVISSRLRHRRDLLRFFEQAPQAMLVVNRSTGVIVQDNARARMLFGADHIPLRGRSVDDLLPLHLQERHRALRDGFSSSERPMSGTRSFAARRLDGAAIELEIGISTIEDMFLVGILDVTERQLALQRLQQILAQQQLLVREVHHRVKNNLQIVSSLLNLQQTANPDPGAVAAMRDSALRIQAMALVHQSLFQGDSIEVVDLSAYLARLTEGVRRSLAVTRPVAFHADPVCVPIDVAVPLGLIVNELLTNAIKHAGAAGVGVELRKHADAMTLVVADEGPGLDASLLERPTTLGLRIVQSLARQAEARLDYARVGGCRFTIQRRLPA